MVVSDSPLAAQEDEAGFFMDLQWQVLPKAYS
jgi:hypothetical protein